MNRYRYRQAILTLFMLLIPSVAIFQLTQRIASDDFKSQLDTVDGIRFLVNSPLEEATPITILSRWNSGKKSTH